jgi:hypothetical protein
MKKTTPRKFKKKPASKAPAKKGVGLGMSSPMAQNPYKGLGVKRKK